MSLLGCIIAMSCGFHCKLIITQKREDLSPVWRPNPLFFVGLFFHSPFLFFITCIYRMMCSDIYFISYCPILSDQHRYIPPFRSYGMCTNQPSAVFIAQPVHAIAISILTSGDVQIDTEYANPAISPE